MKIVFASNFFNHHQAFLSEALHRMTGGNYYFIATGRMSQERKDLGYGSQESDYVRKTYLDEDAKKECQKLIDEADVVITGSAPEELIHPRILAGKLIFRYSERPLKQGNTWWKYPYRFWRWHRNNPRRSPVCMLCASAYTAADYAKFFMFRDRAYRWGYFPEVKEYPSLEELMDKKDPRKLLWCGRFLDWKHPDDALRVAKALKDEGKDFVLEFIGTGQMEEELHRMTRELDLEDKVRFLGSMPPDQVRRHMEEAGSTSSPATGRRAGGPSSTSP